MESQQSVEPVTGAAGNVSPEMTDDFVGEESRVRSHAEPVEQTVQTISGQPEVKN